jgi:hypothetical protein
MRRMIARLVVLLGAGASVAAAQERAAAAASLSLLEHRVNLGGGSGVQRAFGPVVGIQGTYLVTPWLEASAGARVGHLSARTPYAEARDVGEVGFGASVLASPSLAFTGAVQVRSYAGTFGTQRWTSLSVGAEERLEFIGGALHAVFRGAFVPLVSVSGGVAGPNVAVSVGSGLEWTRGKWSGAVVYTLERYDFPERDSARRLEQLGGLTIRVGLRLGRPALPS